MTKGGAMVKAIELDGVSELDKVQWPSHIAGMLRKPLRPVRSLCYGRYSGYLGEVSRT